MYIKVTRAVDLALLVERLQDERAAVALNIFLNRSSGEESIQELQKYSRNDMNITRFNLMTVSLKLHFFMCFHKLELSIGIDIKVKFIYFLQ